MPKKFPLHELRRLVRLHMNWMRMAALGRDAITPEEYEELRQYGKLPMETLDLSKSSYILGRLKSVLTSQEYKDVTYERLRTEKENMSFSESEQLAIEHAKLMAANGLKNLEDEISNGIYSQFAAMSGRLLNEETIRAVVREEVVSALQQRQTAQDLAANLATKLQTHKKDWLKVAKTELHRAKTMGVAQAISNKLGPYAGGDGPDSNVVVIPAPNCCEDCSLHFLDEDGNPRVFKLRDLLAAGSNADAGVSHKKRDGVHLHWKTTLPPLHPNCGCRVQYLPPGTGFVAGKMVVKSLTEYTEVLRKAEMATKPGKAGVGNPVAKPPGPPQASGTPTPASVSGVKSPAQGGGSLASTPKVGGGRGKGVKGPEVDYVSKDSVSKRPPGTIGETDHSYKVIRGMSEGKPPTPEQQEVMNQEKVKDAISWGKKPKSVAEKVNHYKTGKIALRKPLGEIDEATKGGLDKSRLERVTIEGNGRALRKPPHDWESYYGDPDDLDEINKVKIQATGYATVPHDRGHHHEAGAYQLHALFGFQDQMPVTSTRNDADSGPSSMSEWLEDYKPAITAFTKYKPGGNMVSSMLDACPAHKREALIKQMNRTAVMSAFMNDNDAHMGNIMVNDDGEYKVIDKTFSGGNALDGHCNGMLIEMEQNGMKVRISDEDNELFNKTTYRDMVRANGGNYQQWQTAQNYLRMRYTQHVQKTVGHVDGEYFRPTILTASGETLPYPGGGWEGQKHNKNHQVTEVGPEFEQRRDNGTLPSQMFESWAKHYLETASSDPSHPDHSSAKEIQELNPFMPKGASAMKDPTRTRKMGQHHEYANSIVARDIPKDVKVGYKAQTNTALEATPDQGGNKTIESEGLSHKERRDLAARHDALLFDAKEGVGDKQDEPKVEKKGKKKRKGLAVAVGDEGGKAPEGEAAPTDLDHTKVPDDLPKAADDAFSEFDSEENSAGEEEPDATKVSPRKSKLGKGLWLSAASLHKRLTFPSV